MPLFFVARLAPCAGRSSVLRQPSSIECLNNAGNYESQSDDIYDAHGDDGDMIDEMLLREYAAGAPSWRKKADLEQDASFLFSDRR